MRPEIFVISNEKKTHTKKDINTYFLKYYSFQSMSYLISDLDINFGRCLLEKIFDVFFAKNKVNNSTHLSSSKEIINRQQ